MKHAGDVRIICVSRDFPVKFNGKEKMEKTSFEEEGWFGGYFGGKQHSNLLPLLWLLREAVKKKLDILWHRVNFICYLPTLPNYDIFFYDIVVIF